MVYYYDVYVETYELNLRSPGKECTEHHTIAHASSNKSVLLSRERLKHTKLYLTATIAACYVGGVSEGGR